MNQLQTHETVQSDDAGMDAILVTHCIDPTALRQDDFEGFIDSRRQALLVKIETAMGKSIVMSNEVVPEDETDDQE